MDDVYGSMLFFSPKLGHQANVYRRKSLKILICMSSYATLIAKIDVPLIVIMQKSTNVF